MNHHQATVDLSQFKTSANRVAIGLLSLIIIYFGLLAGGQIPHVHVEHGVSEVTGSAQVESPPEPAIDYVPPVWAVGTFVALLLSIALFPLIPAAEHWWHSNLNRFFVAAGLSLATLCFYGLMHPGNLTNHLTHTFNTPAGWQTVSAVFSNAIFSEYIPFIVLLFSLYVISGGINLQGDLPAHPSVNCVFLAAGTFLASFIGTTGAAMVLIRPLLNTNSEREYKVHTVIFFIFMVCNCGGLLLPIGDPPLFLGYLRGVPFTWTLGLWPYWLGVNGALLIVYYIWDRIIYSKEPLRAIIKDEAIVRPLKLTGRINFLLIIGVVLSVALVVPGKPFLGVGFVSPHYFREVLMLLLVIASLKLTSSEVRARNRFDYHAIVEVAALFFGIFICMQVPIEILQARGSSLGISTPATFFWATGLLSSFLDNAPTYVVFFETGSALPAASAGALLHLAEMRTIAVDFLVPISLGAVLMGANTYIGNGPNFMVKSIAEQAGVKMPSFFGYMLFSLGILIPIFLGVTLFI